MGSIALSYDSNNRSGGAPPAEVAPPALNSPGRPPPGHVSALARCPGGVGARGMKPLPLLHPGREPTQEDYTLAVVLSLALARLAGPC